MLSLALIVVAVGLRCAQLEVGPRSGNGLIWRARARRKSLYCLFPHLISATMKRGYLSFLRGNRAELLEAAAPNRRVEHPQDGRSLAFTIKDGNQRCI
jgi:hypothetical protein